MGDMIELIFRNEISRKKEAWYQMAYEFYDRLPQTPQRVSREVFAKRV